MSNFRNTVKQWFKTRFKPTQTQFYAWMNKIWFKDEQIPVQNISGLSQLLNDKADTETLSVHMENTDVHLSSEQITKLENLQNVELSDSITSDSEDIALNLKGAKSLKTLIDNINFLDENNPPYLLDTDDEDTIPDTMRFTFKGGGKADVNMKTLWDLGVLKQVEKSTNYTLNFTTLGGTVFPVSLKSWFDAFAKLGDIEVPLRNFLLNSGIERNITNVGWQTIPLSDDIMNYLLVHKYVRIFAEVHIEGYSSGSIVISIDNVSSSGASTYAIQWQSGFNIYRSVTRIYDGTRYDTSKPISISIDNDIVAQKVVVKNIFVGFGNVKTDWIPAPEDTKTEIKALNITQLTTSSNIGTKDNINGLPQNGRNIVIANGVNSLTITINSTDGFCATYQKTGTGTVAFQTSGGLTLVKVDNTNEINGAKGSTATVSVVGSEAFLRISNV